jgi:hypothetical protein
MERVMKNGADDVIVASAFVVGIEGGSDGVKSREGITAQIAQPHYMYECI